MCGNDDEIREDAGDGRRGKDNIIRKKRKWIQGEVLWWWFYFYSLKEK